MVKRIIGVLCVGLVLVAGLPARGAPIDAAGVWQASRAAKQGHPDAQFKLGTCYYRGEGGLPRDYSQAALWYRRAAEQGNIRAQIALGLCYFHGHGVKKNFWKGFQLILLPKGGQKKCAKD